jgi:hypothetical protein
VSKNTSGLLVSRALAEKFDQNAQQKEVVSDKNV